MPRQPDPHEERIRRMQDGEATINRSWETVLEEMEELAESREAEGMSVETFPAVHTDAVSPQSTAAKDAADPDEVRYGIVHVIADNHEDAFREATDGADFSEYLAFGNEINGFMFLMTELRDPDAQQSVMIAGMYDKLTAKGMINAAERYGTLWIHAKTIDGTPLGSFAIDDYGPLIGEPPAETEQSN